MSPLRRYRLLFVVVALAGGSCAWELSDPDGEVTNAGVRGRMDGHAMAKEAEKRQLSDLLYELYPNRSTTLLNKGTEAMMRGDHEEARGYLDRAMATGVKSSEDLLYVNALELVQSKATPSEIDAAVEIWQFNYPFSSNPDPRKLSDGITQRQGLKRRKRSPLAVTH